MSPEADAPTTSDEEFLDEVFERAVALCEDGAEADVAALLGGRAHLRAEVEALLHTARSVALVRTEALPSVPGYTVLSEIGRGGMGAVYLARQQTLGGRRVALKVLPAAAALPARARERFLAEARAIGGLKHPHVVTVHDVVAADGALAYSMDWVEGASLGAVLDHLRRRRDERPVDDTTSSAQELADTGELLGPDAVRVAPTYPVFVCRIGVAIARALGALHRAGLVHRDVKPSNILLRKDGTPLLSDFGLVHATDADLTHSGHFAGTIAYASPEQLAGGSESLDARSDVYALGVTLYHALTLHLPFDDRHGRSQRATTPTAMLRRIEGGRAAPLRAWRRRLPRDLETIVAKAIEPDPARRYATADEMADDLERLLALQPIRARPAGALERATKLVRRNRAVAWGLGVGSVLSLAVTAALVTYLFVVPQWIAEHVREARLALLDPDQANMIWVVRFFGTSSKDAANQPLMASAGLDAAVERYDAALRWAPFDEDLRAEREAVFAARQPHAPPAPDTADARALRSTGLTAFLRGEFEDALGYWERFESLRSPTQSPDELVEATLGILHLVAERPARAYPRLRAACQAFPDVGFLTVFLADAALQCGDVHDAERLLEAAARFPRQDPAGGDRRVLARLRAAQGRDADAEALYRAAPPDGPAALDFARYLESRGRPAEASAVYAQIVMHPRSAHVREACAAALDRWWRGIPAAQRREWIRRSLDLDEADPASLSPRLRAAAAIEAAAAVAASDRRPELARTGSGSIAPFITALIVPRASRRLEDRSLADLARTLELRDTPRRNRIRSYSPLFKELQLRAWGSHAPQATSRALEAVALWLRPRAPRLAFGAASTRTAGELAGARGCDSPPCFQGLGDLAGGAFSSVANCLSSDGTTVGGASATAESAGELNDYAPMIWRTGTGMVHVGDLAGAGDMGAVFGLSADGSVAVGWSDSGKSTLLSGWGHPEAFRWTQSGGMVGLGDIPGNATYSCAYAVSDDGRTVAGFGGGSGPSGDVQRAAIWTSATRWTVIGGNSSSLSFLYDLSRDGQWAAGHRVGPNESFRWSESRGVEVAESSDSWRESHANAASDDGVIVGDRSDVGGRRAGWVWSGTGAAVQPLRGLSGAGRSTVPQAILRDGTLIVGASWSPCGYEAVIWDESHEPRRVADVLAGAGVVIPPGWTLSAATDIVKNGGTTTICGNGINPAGQHEAWIARFDG